MSLNDNVLDDIYSGDVSLLADNETSMKTVSENINTIIKNSPNPVQDALLNRIVAADANLVGIVDNFNSLCEKKNIQDDIVSTESISRNDAILVNEVFGGLINHSLSLEEFTTVNSKTNYFYTIKHMEKTISKEEDNFINGYKIFLNDILKDVDSVLKKLLEDYCPMLTDKANNLKYHNSNIYDKICSNKNLVIPYKDGFENITNISLLELDPDLIKLDISNRDSFKKTIVLFRQLLNVKELNSFIDILSNKDFNNLYKENSGLEQKSLTISDLAKLLQESDMEGVMSILSKEIKNLSSEINKLKSLDQETLNDFELIKIDFIDDKILFNELVSKANSLTNLTVNLFNLIDTISDLFEYTKQF